MSIFDSVKSLVDKVAGVTKEATQDAKELAESVVTRANTDLSDIKNQATGIINKVVDNAKTAYNEQGGLQGMLDQAKQELTDIAQKTKETATAKTSELKDVVGETFDKASAELKEAAQKTLDTANEVASDIKETASEAIDKVKKG